MKFAEMKSPAPVSNSRSMIGLFQFLTLVSYPGSTDSQTSTTSLLVKGVLGASVTLPLNFPEGQQSQSITWLHDGTSIIFIQTMKERIQVTDPQQKDRLNVTQSYSFHYQISNLIMEDSGPYHAQLTTTTSTVISNYSLEIFRQLRNLQVANHTQLFENGTCEIHLTCSVENPNDHISLWWQVPGNTTLEEANPTISCNPKNSNEQTYTCIANNTVSNAFFSFSIQSLYKGVFNEKNQYLVILWIIMVPSFLCITVCLIVWRKKIAGSFSIQQTQSPVETSRNSEYVPLSPGRTV